MNFYKQLLIVGFLALMLSCSQEGEEIFKPILESKVSYTKLENEILKRVNIHRDSIGLNKLEKLDLVSAIALSHSKYMVEKGKVSHDNFSNRYENLIVNADAKFVGENVAFGFDSAKGVVYSWLKSNVHRAVIENPNFTHFGISTEKNIKERNYFTQIFIEK
ncbi:CAP domain-containing protein [Lutibacter citreus]|uniref:CAP domain-containing protein n=1 Tax=Lutibacter citreus TaxID=2138210 RepID=UPI0013007862|nr:CAP domain-containing protein [Lutibacter citreus]